MVNPWFKFYGGEYLSDPKIGLLTPQERSCWITLLCMASTSDKGGVIEFLTVDVLLEKSGIRFDQNHQNEWDRYLKILSTFERMRMIKILSEDSIELVNWAKRQESAMTATERSRKYRAKMKEKYKNATNETKCNENATIEKRREEKNREEYNTNTGDKPQPYKFKKPTLEEVSNYCNERKNKISAQAFIDFYESNGWKVGRNLMKDWKAAIRTWEQRSMPKNEISRFNSVKTTKI